MRLDTHARRHAAPQLPIRVSPCNADLCGARLGIDDRTDCNDGPRKGLVGKRRHLELNLLIDCHIAKLALFNIH